MAKDEFEDAGHVEDLSVSSSSDTESPNAPINWPAWKRNAQILMVAVHSMDSVFMAAGIIPGYVNMAKEYNISVQKATYLTSIMVCQYSLLAFSQAGPNAGLLSRFSSLELPHSSGFP